MTACPQAKAVGSSSVAQVAQAAGSAASSRGSSVLIPKEARLNPSASVFCPFGITQQVPLNTPASIFAPEPEKNKTPSLELSALAALNDAVAAWTSVVKHYLPPPAVRAAGGAEKCKSKWGEEKGRSQGGQVQEGVVRSG